MIIITLRIEEKNNTATCYVHNVEERNVTALEVEAVNLMHLGIKEKMSKIPAATLGDNKEKLN